MRSGCLSGLGRGLPELSVLALERHDGRREPSDEQLQYRHGLRSSAAFPSSVNVWSAGQSSAPVALAFNTTITPDFSTGNIFTVTLTGNATLANPNNLVAGQCGQLFVTQDSTGSRTLAYGSEWKFPGGTAPTLTTTPNATDILSFCSWSTTQIAAQLTSNVK